MIMARRLLSRRPSDLNAAQGFECEVFVIDKRPIEKRLLKFTFGNKRETTLKEVVEKICEELNILPVHSALFGLSYDQFGGKHYLPYSTVIDEDVISKKRPMYFRLQFKIVDCATLKDDPSAFNYYILQCRHDFVHGQFKENLFQMPTEPRKQEMLLRMLILEMLLVSKDENMSKKDGTSHLHQIFKRRHRFSIEDVLTKYIDDRSKNRSEEVKKCKKIIEKSLQMFITVEKPEMDFVREVNFLPEYSREVFENLVKVYGVKEATVLDNVWISVHPAEGIARIRSMDGQFQRVEEKTPFSKVAYLSIKKNSTNPHAPKYQLFVGKKDNQEPEVFSTDSLEDLQCICSWVDGYYRLFVDQYTCLSKDCEIPTKVHGPIDRSTAVQLLESIKCSEGDYLVRQHRHKHKALVITVRAQDKFEHHECAKHDEIALEKFLKSLPLPPDYLKRRIKPSLTGPVPFISKLLKAMPTLKRAVSAQKVEVQLLHPDSVIKQTELSKGRFGTVWLCKQRKDSGLTSAAIRYFDDNEISQQAFEKLCRSYMQISSRVIVRITGRSELTDTSRFLAFEYMNGGTLSNYLSDNRNSIRYRNLLKYFSDIAEGMMYLEVDLNFVHGNLNCHNILMLDNGDIKISDCCFDVVLQQEGTHSNVIDSSCNWRAPEVLNGEPMTHQSDAWSFGMTMWQMMALAVPFGPITSGELLENLKGGARPPLKILPYCHEEIESIMVSSWTFNPAERNNFKTICDRLDRYRRGGGQNPMNTPVSTYLMNRHYYNWKEEKTKEKAEQMQCDLDARRRFTQSLTQSAESLESVNTGSSNSGSGGFLVRQTSSCGQESFSSAGSDEAVRLLSTRQEVSENQIHFPSAREQDVEMLNFSNSEAEGRITSSSIETSLESLQTSSQRRSKKRLIVEEDDKLKMDVSESEEAGLLSKSKSRRISLGQNGTCNDVKVTSDEEFDSGISEAWTKEKHDAVRVSMPCSMPDQGGSAVDQTKSDKTDEDKTVLEVATVLASMAQNRDASKFDNSQTNTISSPSVLFPGGIKQQGIHFFQNSKGTNSHVEKPEGAFLRREQLESGYESGGQGTMAGGRVPGNANQKAVLIEQDIAERKKRSRTLSKEISNMQKKAAKRALDRPNPFNLGATIPKNFLLTPKDPIKLPPKSQQPGEMSKFFSEIPQTFSSILQDSRAGQQGQPFEESIYRATSDIRNLEERLSSMKTSSPASSRSSLMDDGHAKSAQSLAYVVSPSQPMPNQSAADQSAIQATINAYLANLGQSLVAGNSVLLPQLTLNTSANQTAANSTQILQLLQAQQKMGQITQVTSQEELLQQKSPVDSSVHMSTANCLQTLLAIVASKSIIGHATATPQQHKVVPTSPMLQQQHQAARIITATSSQVISPAMHPTAVKVQDQTKKVIDIKPKPSVIDSIKSDPDVIMVPVSVKSSVDQTSVLPTVSSIGILDGRSLPVQRPLSVVGVQNTRPTVVDAKMPMTRPLLVKASAGAPSARTQHLILPKNLPEKLGKIEHPKELKLAPKPVQMPMRNIKAEPVSPQELRPKPMPGYKPLETASTQGIRSIPTLPMDVVRSLSDKVANPHSKKRPSIEEQQRKLISQLGDLKIFRKEDLTFKKKLGEGQFGEVWQAMLKYQTANRGEVKEGLVAVKKLKADKERRWQMLQEFMNEVKQMASLEHEFIVKLIGVSIDPTGEINDPWIITEWMPQGSLEHFIVTQRQTLETRTLLTFGVQIAEGMEFLQTRRIVHRDLATRNVLVESRDRVKVCDFGLSRMFGEKDYYRSRSQGPIPVRWFAPESISKQKFTAESDVWSFGITLWEMFELWSSGREHAVPYQNIDHRQILAFLEKAGRLEKPWRCQDDLWKLIRGCWEYNPDERYSFYRLSYEIRNLIPTYSSTKDDMLGR